MFAAPVDLYPSLSTSFSSVIRPSRHRQLRERFHIFRSSGMGLSATETCVIRYCTCQVEWVEGVALAGERVGPSR